MQKVGQTEVKKLKTTTFPPRELFPAVHGHEDTQRDGETRGHTDRDTFSGNYSGNHRAVRARASPSPAPGVSKLPPPQTLGTQPAPVSGGAGHSQLQGPA